MAKERTSVRMQAQIKTMSEQGHSIRSIARVLKLSRRTVRKYLEPVAQPPSENGGWDEKIDWDYVRQEVYGKGTTVKQIQQEVAPEIGYVKFWRAFREQAGRQASPEQVTIRLNHKPAEKTQIDFCDGLWITEWGTGKKTLTQFFLGVLPFSSYTFGEFVLDQKLSTFIGLQQRMFAFFGGVTPYVVVDNLKSGVHRADLYDPDVNPTYCDFANHVGFAVLPARPYKARDKGSGESHIGVVQRGFFQEVRLRIFYSLEELNEALRHYLERLNHQVMKDYRVSRAERFSEEQTHLKALPPSPFELSEWRGAKVHPDCHVQVEKNFYSVPFVYVGQKIRVRLTEKMVELFRAYRMDCADTATIEKKRDEWKAHGLTAASVNKVLTTLSAIFDKQIALRTIRFNPVTLAERMATGSNEVGENDEINIDSVEVRPEDIYSPDQLLKLIQSAEPGFDQTILTTFALTMVRHGEGLGFMWLYPEGSDPR